MWETASARRQMKEAGLPIIPGSSGPTADLSQARACAEEVGYPLLVKAALGGGGIGMTKVKNVERLEKALRKARDRAERSFGSPLVYVERLLETPRHVEVQVLAEADGTTFHVLERECSVSQRRHQKGDGRSTGSSVGANLAAQVASSGAPGYGGCWLSKCRDRRVLGYARRAVLLYGDQRASSGGT